MTIYAIEYRSYRTFYKYQIHMSDTKTLFTRKPIWEAVDQAETEEEAEKIIARLMVTPIWRVVPPFKHITKE